MEKESQAFEKLYPQEFLQRFLAKGLRPDGRGLTSARDVTVHVSPISGSPGSAIAKVGNTTVVTSAEVSLLDLGGDEGDDDEGRVSHALDVGPLGATHNDGSVAKTRQQVASVSGRVQGVLSRCVDLRSLKLEGEGGKAWLVGLKSVCLSLDGGLFDAALASCVAALSSLRLPGEVREVVGGGEGRESSEAVVAMEEDRAPSRPVDFLLIPAATAVSIHGDRLLADPTAFEEALAGAEVSAAWGWAPSGGGGDPELVSLEVRSEGHGRATVDADVVHRCLAVSRRRSEARWKGLLGGS